MKVQVPDQSVHLADLESNISKFIIQNLLHTHTNHSDFQASELKRLYGNICAHPQSCDKNSTGKPPSPPFFTVHPIQVFRPANNAPDKYFFWDMEITNQGQIIGIDRDRRQLVCVDFTKGIVPLNHITDRKLHSLSQSPQGFVLLDADGQYVFEIDNKLQYVNSHRLHGIEHTSSGLLIRRMANGYAIIDKSEKTFFFLDNNFHLCTTIHLDFIPAIYDCHGYEKGGLLLMDRKPEKVNMCEILWISEQGEILPVLNNLLYPFDISITNNGILVCDMTGIHFFSMDSFTASFQGFIPWKYFADLLDMKIEFIHEACIHDESLFIKFQFCPALSPEHRHFILAKFKLHPSSQPTERQ